MRTCRIALAGVSPLADAILRRAVADTPWLRLVQPWTSLPALGPGPPALQRDVLVVEVAHEPLPRALELLVRGAPALRLLVFSEEARLATLVAREGARIVLHHPSAQDICRLLAPDGAPAVHAGSMPHPDPR